MKALRLAVHAALPALLLACGSGSEDPTAVRGEVREPVAMTLSPQAATLDAVGAHLTLTLTVLDQNGEAYDRPPLEVRWTSFDPTVATVSAQGLSGVVTARGSGTTTIVAAMANHGALGQDIEADATLTVTEP